MTTAGDQTTARAPSAARSAWSGSIASGSSTMQSASATATCGSRSTTAGPSRRERVDDRQHQRGRRRRHQHGVQRRVRDADEAGHGVPEEPWRPRRRRRRGATPVRSAGRSRGSRTGTWVPATNITSTKPPSPRKVNVGSPASSTPKPVSPEHHAGQQLAQHDRQVPATRGGQERAGQGDRAHDRQVEERHERRLDPDAGMKRPPTHPAELACPCCLPALGEFSEMPPHGGLAAKSRRARTSPNETPRLRPMTSRARAISWAGRDAGSLLRGGFA